MRWVLIDEILEIERGVSASAAAHIPEGAFSPEVFMIEMMAQTAGLLLGAESDYARNVIFAKIEDAEFWIEPGGNSGGEPVTIHATPDQMNDDGAWFNTVIRKGDRVIAKARLLLMALDHLGPSHPQSITFHENFMDHFRVRDHVSPVWNPEKERS